MVIFDLYPSEALAESRRHLVWALARLVFDLTYLSFVIVHRREAVVVSRRYGGRLEHACWRNVVHAAGGRNRLRVAPMQVHAMTFDRVTLDGERVDAGQHRSFQQVERIHDRPTER
jgi:hypothetical protein